MRFLHLGDPHVKEGPDLDDTVQALAFVADLAHREKVDAVLCPGDLHDAKSTPVVRQAVRQFIVNLDPIPLILCKGNHDMPGDLLVYDLARNVQVYEQPALLEFGEVDILILPWPERAHLAARGFTGEGGLQAAQQALADLIRGMAANRDTSRPLIVMGHLSVCGAISSSGQPMVGREIQVVLGDLEDIGALVLLNHIHKPQTMGVKTIYAGSLTCQDFGEEGEEKQVSLFIGDGPRWCRHTYKVPCRTWFTIEAGPSPTGLPPWEQVGKDCPEPEALDALVVGANIRYRYTCTEEEAGLFDHAAIERRFASAHSLKIVPQVTRSHQRVRAAEVAEAKTVADKLRAWGRATETDITPGMLGKLDSIQGRR